MQRIMRAEKIVAVLFLAGVGAGVWWWRGEKGTSVTYTTAEMRRGEVEATISATGTIEPLETVDVGAQVAGRISGFGTDKEGKAVDYGSEVEKGGLLARIDDSVYAAELSVAKAGLLSAEANLEQMEARLDQAAAEWKRAQDLYANKLMAQVDYDTDKANYEIAKANVSVARSGIAQAKADLEKAERNVEFCTIKSPVSGVIIDRRVNAGQTVVASLNAPSLFLIARDLRKMQIWVAVNEADVGRIKEGMGVTFTVDAFPGREFEGRVGRVRLNAQMTQNIVLYTVEIGIENPEKLLLPYLTANVHFVLRRETNVLVAPNGALRWWPSRAAEVAPSARAGKAGELFGGEGAEGDGASGKDNGEDTTRGILWVKDGEFVRPVEVTRGITDGANTVVTGEGVREGEEVVTGETTARGTDVSNPFLPKRLGRH